MRHELKLTLRLGVALMSLLALALVGCANSGSDSTGHDANQDASVDEVPPDDTQRDDLSNEHVVEWQRYEQVSDTQIRVFFTIGSPRCYGARAVVEESAETVEIATIEGTLPDAPEVCTLEARLVSMLVETNDPVGDREVVPQTDPELR